MITNRIPLVIELLCLFILIPIILTLNIHPAFKVIPAVTGIVYIIIISAKKQLFTGKSLYAINKKDNWKLIGIQFITFVIISTVLMYYLNYENLFIVPRKNWLLWITITIFYSIFSVYPQEFLYRSFFFKRYKSLFKNPIVFIIFNAFIFSFAHIALNNMLVLLLTFVGGILFASTYRKSKSLLLTSIEHTLYGSWLFTLGMGEMLAFPMPH